MALVVCWSGVGIARDIIDKLLGSPASEELVNQIKEQILSHPEILGVHDMPMPVSAMTRVRLSG